jgi:iron complex outermembrane receptor protein
VGTSTNGAGAFGATVNFRTLSMTGRKAFAEIQSSAGSFNSFKNSISLGTGLIKNKFSLNAHISHITSDGFINRAFSDLTSYYLNGSYYTGKSVIRLNLFSGKEKTYQAWDGIPAYILKDPVSGKINRTYNGMGQYTDIYGNTKYYGNETDNYIQNHYQLIFSSELNDDLNLNLALHYTYGEGYYEQYRDDDALSDYGLPPIHINDTVLYIQDISFIFPDSQIYSTDLIRRRMMDNDFYGFTYSLNWKQDNIQTTIGGSANEYDGRHFGRIIWEEFANPQGMNYEWYRSTGIKKEFSVFEKISLQATEFLNIYEDIQYRRIDYRINGIDNDLRDITQNHRFNFLNPKLGVFYSPRDNQDFYLMLGIANKEPTRSNYTDADPAKVMPVSERLYDYELGWHYRTAGFNLSANLFLMNYKDQLILTGEINDVGAPVMVNVPESYRKGIEISTGLSFKKYLKWNANITLSRNKIRNFTEYVDMYDSDWNFIGQKKNYHGETDIAFSPNCIAANNIVISVINGLNLNFNSKYVGKQYIDNTASTNRMLYDYFENSLRIDYMIHTKYIREIEINLLINNVFDAKYETNAWVYRYMTDGEYGVYDGYFPQAGRNFLAGIRLKL